MNGFTTPQVKSRGPLFLAITAAFLTGAVFVLILCAIKYQGETLLSNVGGVGQGCYPNGTCEPALTCFEVQEEDICLRDVKTVVPKGANYCFEYLDEDGSPHAPCLKDRRECIISFGRILQSEKSTVQRGCHPAGEQ